MNRIGAYPDMSKKCFDISYAQAKTCKEKTSIALECIYAVEAELKAKDERITELEAKLDGLRGYCRKQIEHFNSKNSRSDYDWGLRDRTITILDKLDEGKEQGGRGKKRTKSYVNYPIAANLQISRQKAYDNIAELETKLKNMCAECEGAKFADNATKPSEMWKLYTALKDNKYKKRVVTIVKIIFMIYV